MRLSWIPRDLDCTREGPRKSYFTHYLKRYGGIFLLKCNYEINDLNISLNLLYSELLAWWQRFIIRNSFADVNYAQNVNWNNNNSVFYRSYDDHGITYINNLSFELDNVQSHDFYRGLKEVSKPTF